MGQRINGIVHIGWPKGYFASAARQLEVAADETASWQLSGYLVTLPPNDGQDHTFNEPCLACGVPADPG